MSGYDITVSRQPSEVLDGEEVKRIDCLSPAVAPKDPSKGFLPTFNRQVLAAWQTDYDGLDWIEDLVKTGKAIRLRGGGWPSLYTATAENLISQIIDGPPMANDNQNKWVEGDVKPSRVGTWINRTRAAACPPDEWLRIEAWDTS
jgi:hypothetical protein